MCGDCKEVAAGVEMYRLNSTLKVGWKLLGPKIKFSPVMVNFNKCYLGNLVTDKIVSFECGHYPHSTDKTYFLQEQTCSQ